MRNLLYILARKIVTAMSKIHFPFTRKGISGTEFFEIYDRLKVGDVLLSVTRGELSNVFNPCGYKHAAIFCGKDKRGVPYVIEATMKGVKKTDLISFIMTKDQIALCTPSVPLSDDKQEEIVKNANLKIGVPYDFLFIKGEETFYCFELVAYLYSRIGRTLRWDEVMGCKHIYSDKTFLDENFRVAFYQ